MSFYPIIKVAFDGTVTAVAKTAEVMAAGSCALDSSGNLWTIDETVLSSGIYGLYKIVSPGGVGETKTLYYTFTTLTISDETAGADVVGLCSYWRYLRIYGNNLYFLYLNSADYSTYQLVKFTNITGTAAMTIEDTGISLSTITMDIVIKSNTEIYLVTTFSVIKLIYSGTTWVASTVITTDGIFYDQSQYPINPLKINSLGNFSLGGVLDGTDYTVKTYDSNFNLTSTITIPTISGTIHVAPRIGTSPEYIEENIFTVCGYLSDDVWLVYPDGFWTIITDTINESETTEPTMSGVIVNIVSNYIDLGISNDKRIKRLYLDTESEYATCGAVTIEPDYGVNMRVHTDGESAEPSSATSIRPFAHPGRQTWTYTNTQFDGAIEAWLSHRLDVGAQGKAFRYSIKIGDIPDANTGTLHIRPPKILVQVKGNY